MKKLLALVLALVMSLSLVTISNAAFESYDDADKISYVEAAEVFKALGVLEGTDNAFNPTEKLTREQAAKIVAYLALGKEAAEALPELQVFDDVAATRWSSKYVAYCAQEGIISGVGNNKFNPTGELTGYQFAKMLLCALGYKADVEGYVNSGWEIAVSKKMAELDPKLNKGVDGSANGVLTREQAAQYMFNAIQNKYVVKYSGNGGNVTIGDIVINNDPGEAVLSDKTYMKQNFEKLVKDTDAKNDDFGRPATTWNYKGEKIGTYGETADYVLTSKKAYDNADKLFQDLVNEDYTAGATATYWVNGVKDTSGDAVAIAKGDVVELFMNDNDKIATVVIIRYDLGKITKVSTKITKADKEDGVEAYVSMDKYATSSTVVSALEDTNFAGFDYEKDDVVLYVLSKDGKKVIASQLAESVEGKVTAKKGDTIAIDGTYYDNTDTSIKLNDKGTFYLNVAGQVMDAKASTEKSGNYAYIYNVIVDDSKNSDGEKTWSATVYYVDQNGVKGSATVDADIKDSAKAGTSTTTSTSGAPATSGDPAKYDEKYVYYADTTTAVTKGVVAYKINSDGEFQLVAEEDEIVSATIGASGLDKDSAVIKSGSAYATSKTNFVFVYQKDGKTTYTVDTVTGYKNVNIAENSVVTAIVDDDDNALYVFVGSKKIDTTSDALVAVLLDTEYNEYENEDDEVIYEYSVAIDGEETTLAVKKANALNYAEGTVFTYKLDGEYAKADSKLSFVKVTAANDDYVKVDGNDKQFDASKGTVYTVTIDYKKDGTTIDSVSVTEDGAFEKDDMIAYTLDDGDFDVVFVLEEIK